MSKERRYCKGCYADVTKDMMCFCGEFSLTKESTLSEEDMAFFEAAPNPEPDSKDRVKKLIQDAIKEIAEWYLIEITEEQVKEFLSEQGAHGLSFDTLERETFISWIAYKVTGTHWPCNGDSEKYKETFTKSFNESIEEKGFKLIKHKIIENGKTN